MGNFKGAVRAWNGRTNALCDREALTAGNDPIIKRLEQIPLNPSCIRRERRSLRIGQV